MSRKRKHKRKPLGMKIAVTQALLAEADVRDLAIDHGLSVRIHAVQCCRGRVETHHWQFVDDDGIALEWWPGTGKWWSKRTGQRGKVADVWQALDEAARISSLRFTLASSRPDNPSTPARAATP